MTATEFKKKWSRYQGKARLIRLGLGKSSGRRYGRGSRNPEYQLACRAGF